MTAIANTLATAIHLPRLSFPRLFDAERRRRQTTIDLIHSSAHLLRDIGATESNLGERHK